MQAIDRTCIRSLYHRPALDRLLGKLAARLPASWPRLVLLLSLLAGLASITQLPIYGGGGHGPLKLGPLQELLRSLDKEFGAGSLDALYVAALVLALLPILLAVRRNPLASSGASQ